MFGAVRHEPFAVPRAGSVLPARVDRAAGLERPAVRRFYLACAFGALLAGIGVLVVARPPLSESAVWLQAVVLPAALLVLMLANLRDRWLPLLLTLVLLWAEALITAALYTIGLAFAVVIPLIGIGLVQPYVARRGTIVLYAATLAVATAATAISAAGVPTNPLGHPAFAVVAFALLAAFALGMVGRVAERWREALGAREVEMAARVAAERRLAEAEAVRHVAAVVAHDANNAMAAVLGYAELIQTEARDASAVEWAGQIAHAADRVSGMSRDLLAYAGLATGRPRAVDAVGVVEALLPALRRDIAPGVGVVASHAIERGPVVIDPERLSEALRNLVLDEGRSLLPGGRVTVATARRPGTDGGALIAISVAGVGERRQAEGATSDGEAAARLEPYLASGGTVSGLELAMVRGIVAAAGGETVVFRSGDGSRLVELLIPETVKAPE